MVAVWKTVATKLSYKRDLGPRVYSVFKMARDGDI